MTAYLNLACDYFRHPKTVRLIGLVGRGAEVLPIRLWSHCGEFHCEDGKLSGYTDEEIEALAGWWGERGKALEGMNKVGYMEKQNGVWRMSGWKEHQGHISALKVRGRRMAEARWNQYRRAKPRDAGRNADSIAQAKPKQSSLLPTKPTDPAGPPKRSGGGGADPARKAKTGEPAKDGRFPVPEFTALPKPLFADKAKSMLEDCESIITDIKKRGTAEQGVKDELGYPVPTLLHEAKEAINAWRRRMVEIRQARAG